MGLKEVKDEIVEEAREEAEEIKEEAEEEAEEILEEARQEAEKLKENARQEAETEMESMEKKELSNARMEARQLELQAKQDKIDEVFRNFERRVRQMSEGEREDFVSSCIDQVDFDIGSAEASEEFMDAVESEGVDVEEIEEPGVVLISDGGERRRDFRLERIVENYRDEERKEVAEVLFDQ
jgi:V/A-type H+-transporting ATPase subunit E